jgi:hypothetical protein
MSTGFLNALVTFANNGDRTRAANAIASWVSAWNAAHPNAVFIGSVTNTTFEGLRAAQVAYLCTDYSGIEAAQLAINNDVQANAFLDIVNLSTWQNP